MRYLLDTNVVIALLRDNQDVWARLRSHHRRDSGISVVVAHELYYGAYRGLRSEKALAQVESFRFTILDFTDADARKAAEIRAALTAAGTPIGPDDILIAGQALAHGLTLVTRNTREFARVPGLSVENWENGNP